MAQMQAVAINFAQGLDTKTDPFQVPLGKFLALDNSIFTKAGLLQKRNGFGPLATIPINVINPTVPTKITTLNGNLTAIGSQIEAFSQSNSTWVPKGRFTPISLSVRPAARSAINQTQCDAVTSSSGLTCVVYTENNNGTISY